MSRFAAWLLFAFWAAAGLPGALAASPSAAVAAADGEGVGLDRLRQARRIAAREAYPAFSEEEAFSAAVKGYLNGIDAYSTYIPPAEARALRAASGQEFSGVGMDIIQDHKGFLHCLPYAGSPAEQAGIAYGDRLRSIDGIPAEGLPLQSVMGRIRGLEGSTVALGIVGDGGLREVVLTRGRILPPAVELLRGDTPPRIRITRFDKRTRGELLAALAHIVAGSPVILDLRGNVGGDLQAAVDCAGFFLPDGATVVTMRAKHKTPVILRARTDAKASAGAVILWQDRFTASAAEVFCAALSQNGRGQTLGQRSFGKGVTQKVMPAEDGGLYVITNAELLPPNGQGYDRKGLEPDLPVAPGSAPMHRDFLRKTHEALENKHHSQ